MFISQISSSVRFRGGVLSGIVMHKVNLMFCIFKISASGFRLLVSYARPIRLAPGVLADQEFALGFFRRHCSTKEGEKTQRFLFWFEPPKVDNNPTIRFFSFSSFLLFYL